MQGGKGRQLSSLTLALEHLTGFFYLALQTPFLISFLSLLGCEGSCVPNSVVEIPVSEAGTVASSATMINIAAAKCIFNMVVEASPCCLESTLRAPKWRHCLTFRCPNNFQALAASNWRLLGQLNLLFFLNITKYKKIWSSPPNKEILENK